MGNSRAVIITVVLALLVAGGAVGVALYLRNRDVPAAQTPPPPTAPATPTDCRVEPCAVLAAATVGNTKIELVADQGAKSGRLRIGPDRVIEVTITDRGAALTGKSLQCMSGSLSACLVKGDLPSGGTIGEIVVGRSEKWNLTERSYLSDAGYLALQEVTGDGGPELVAAQQGFYLRVYQLDGSELGCTRTVGKLEQIAGWPNPKVTKTQLKACT
ncbi:hypothetical protein [Actinocrispum sp. NPDC049592]|uniref:hypothetical protein n=1 Tax=Actinocrispum sp. NPDC049592 TaxID=3154835 RepID=UPI00341AC3A2